ncbi:MAG: hypothetical protein ABIK75_07035 [candidate division WOR-3 bacterium]
MDEKPEEIEKLNNRIGDLVRQYFQLYFIDKKEAIKKLDEAIDICEKTKIEQLTKNKNIIELWNDRCKLLKEIKLEEAI